jgi:predicted transcriptional regulator YdeE
MPSAEEFHVRGFRISIVRKPAFEAVGYTTFVRLDGTSIGAFIRALTDGGQMQKLSSTLQAPQQVWVCLSGNEGRRDADCRCTACVERTPAHDFSDFAEGELFVLHVPASAWAVFEVGTEQTPRELHHVGVYNMIGEIGCSFNHTVGLHFDNQHEWKPGKTMHFLLPVTFARE